MKLPVTTTSFPSDTGGVSKWVVVERPLSQGTSAHTITFYVRPNVLWRQSRWRCGYEYMSSHRTATLYLGDIAVADSAMDSLFAMLHLAECWRQMVKSDGAAQLVDVLRADGDGREAPRALTA